MNVFKREETKLKLKKMVGLRVTNVSDWLIDQLEPVAFKTRLESVHVSQKA